MKQTPLLRKTPMKRSGPIKRSPLVKAAGAKPKATKPKVRSLKAIKSQADLLAAAFCKSGGECAAAGHHGIKCSGRLEWAHLRTRGILHMRHHPRNSAPLCWAHHNYYTGRPDHWTDFINATRPGTWQFLDDLETERKNCKVKMPLRDIYLGWIGFYKGLNSSAQDSETLEVGR